MFYFTSGHVQSCSWSPCGSLLLFATDSESSLFSLNFGDNDSSATAVPVANLSKIADENGER